MAFGCTIRENQYYDSIFLMTVNRRISEVKGVQQTAVLMGSPANKQLLANIGMCNAQIEAAQPNDLIVVVEAETEVIIDHVLGRLDEWLNADVESVQLSKAHTIEEGLAFLPNANLAAISVPGEYAAREARKAIQAGLHVFLFSDNVSIEDELDLKQEGKRQGLLVMGPDCGTSLIGGVGLGFTNGVRRGTIGVIGATGTGLQEFTCQVHHGGYGISHAIGVGSHDLSEKIGALTAFAALDALEADPQTHVIGILSKPPAMATLQRLLNRIAGSRKPVIGCFLGVDAGQFPKQANFQVAHTIDEAARLAIQFASGSKIPSKDYLTSEDLKSLAQEKASWSAEQKYLRGVLASGTFCFQTQQVLSEAGIKVYSNSPLGANEQLENPDRSVENTLVDMGDDYFMVGKPHPMLDGTMRRRRILMECLDPQMAVLYLDFILGYNVSMDPVGELLDAILEAKQSYKQRGGALTVVASICGTVDDPQNLELQETMLRDAGALVYHSNVQAAAACAWLLGKR